MARCLRGLTVRAVRGGAARRQEELQLQPHTYNVLLRLCTLVTSSADAQTQYDVSSSTANDAAGRVFEHMKSNGVRAPPPANPNDETEPFGAGNGLYRNATGHRGYCIHSLGAHSTQKETSEVHRLVL
jgi:hypothetical protein